MPRLVLAPFFAHPFDVFSWYTLGENLLNGKQAAWSLLVPYDYSLFLFAIPAAMSFNILSSVLGPQTISISSLNPLLNPGAPWNVTVVPGLLFDLLVKLPLITSDLIIALLIHKLVLTHMNDEKLALLASALWFLNPLVIWISSVWGMFDTIPTLFTVLALYFLLEKHFVYSGVSIALAIAMKYYAVVLIVPLMIIAWKDGKAKALVRSFGGVTIASLLFFLPSLVGTGSSVAFLTNGLSTSGLHYSGLSFWTAITLFADVRNQSLFSGVLVLTLLLGSYAWIWKRQSPTNLFSASLCFALPILTLLLGYGFVGENYFVWVLPFAGILASKKVRTIALYWLISIVALVSSTTDSLLPYYMLPIAPWIGGNLINLLTAVSAYRIAPEGVIRAGISAGKILLSALGISSAILIVANVRGWIKEAAVR